MDPNLNIFDQISLLRFALISLRIPHFEDINKNLFSLFTYSQSAAINKKTHNRARPEIKEAKERKLHRFAFKSVVGNKLIEK